MLFKSPRIKQEFAELENRNETLYDVMTKVELIADQLGIAEPVLTCIFRTPEENAACGGIDKSPHLIWNAVDIRSAVYKLDEIQDLVEAVNKLGLNYHGKPIALYHRVANGAYHIHFQVLPEEA